MNNYIFITTMLFALNAFSLSTLSDLEAERLDSEVQKALIYSKINILQNNIQSLSEELILKKHKLSQRLQSMSVLKNNKWRTLLGLKNIRLLQRNLNTTRSINEYDINFIREQFYKLDELKKEKLNLTKNLKEFDEIDEKLIAQEKLILAAENEEHNYLIKELKPSLLLLKGQLSKPINSLPIEFYGLQKTVKHSNEKSIAHQYIIYNKGILFDSKTNQNVQAIGPGKVIFSDVLNHWGESIILEHDGGYYSVYAKVKNCIVQLNQKVQMSEKLCEASSDSFYFELRHFKNTINPNEWIKNL